MPFAWLSSFQTEKKVISKRSVTRLGNSHVDVTPSSGMC